MRVNGAIIYEDAKATELSRHQSKMYQPSSLVVGVEIASLGVNKRSESHRCPGRY
jgi:hypothetical protein